MANDQATLELRRLAPDLAPSIARLTIPAYILDRSATVRWMNDSAIAQFGDLRGKRVTQIVEPAFAAYAKDQFTAKLIGTTTATEATVEMRTADGQRVVAEISSTQLLDNGSVVGVFGLASPLQPARPGVASTPHLTPRQLEVLRHLATGHSTRNIAALLGISVDTVRNHVRALMQRLGTHSRLAAVIRAHELGLV